MEISAEEVKRRAHVAELATTVESYRRTHSLKRTGLELGVSQTTVSRRLDAAGVRRGPKGRPRTAPRERVHALRAQGFTFRVIGRELGISTQRAHFIYYNGRGAH